MPDNNAETATKSGDILIDAMLLGSRWIGPVVTYAFPGSSSDYNGGQPGYPSDWHLQNFQPIPTEWRTFAVTLLDEVASFADVTFAAGASTQTASLRWGRFDDPGNGSYAYAPGSQENSGDQWFANNENPDPVTGEGVAHILRHELGHALGLSHPHDGLWGPMPLDYDSLEYSTMSYRQQTTQHDGDYSGLHNEQSYMMLDIAALQHLYGANFSFNAADTTYVFDPATGQMKVNGAGGAVPAYDVVLRTIWDGGGIDTYDFSNFNGDQDISLQPGAWSTFDQSMLAVLLQREVTPGAALQPIYAAGNLANSLLYQGDARSLIENATTGNGDDRIVGNVAANILRGNGGDDILWGMEGDDTLIGGLGVDTLVGGKGDDTYHVDSNADVATEAKDEGTDLIISSVSFTMKSGSYVENLTLTGSSNLNGTGNGIANLITGNSGNNILNGGKGDDVLIGGKGNDTYYVDSNADVVTEKNGEGTDLIVSSVSFVMKAGSYVENLTLSGSSNLDGTGNGIANIITGNAGNNVLNGGKANDTLIGGKGSDTYYVDSNSDLIVEAKGEGTDIVYSTVSFVLKSGVYVEALTLTGSANINGTGNGIDNVLTGNAGVNKLTGGKGDDSYYVQNSGDSIVEAKNEGTDTVYSTVSFVLKSGVYVENLTLTGSANINGTGNGIANILRGNTGNNVLNGGAGSDKMYGGKGNDTYYVDSSGDKAYEANGEGTDTVISSVSYTLKGQYIEKLTLTGSADLNATGNTLDNILTGNSGVNKLTGGEGNDTYYIQNTTDSIVEAKDEGTDLIVSSVSFVMKSGSYVENLTLTGSGNLNATGNGIANVITGNAGNNAIDGGAGSDKLYGNAGNDTLNGGTSGSDKMYGGTGNDVFYVNSSGDKAYEEKNEGTDHVYSTVNYKLTGEYIEYLTLTGSADVYAKGNTLDNRLVGNSGDNKINGMEGQDRLTGGGGSDTFIWDATSHSKVNDSDRITDLTNSDFIDLSRIDANTTTGGTQHFVLVDAFTHTAGQVTLTFDGTYTNLNADTNGDGVSDMLVRIDGDHEDFDNFIFGGG